MNTQVKDFHSREITTRYSEKPIALNCAGCGRTTRRYDHLYGWHVCTLCDSDEVAEALADHVTNPNRGYAGGLI